MMPALALHDYCNMEHTCSQACGLWINLQKSLYWIVMLMHRNKVRCWADSCFLSCSAIPQGVGVVVTQLPAPSRRSYGHQLLLQGKSCLGLGTAAAPSVSMAETDPRAWGSPKAQRTVKFQCDCSSTTMGGKCLHPSLPPQMCHSSTFLKVLASC